MRARVVAPLVAAVLGIGGGVATALVVPADDEPGTGAFSDPLHLGIPLTDQDCSGQSILVVGYGDSVPPLSSAVANSGTDRLHYLQQRRVLRDRCWAPRTRRRRRTSSTRAPTTARATPARSGCPGEEPGSFVARLREGNTQLVKCPCEIPGTDAVRLYPEMPSDASAKLWIRGLQAMFNDDDPEDFPRSAITGDYDAFTQARVAVFQDNAPGKNTDPGIVDATTWGILTDRLCRNYDY